MRSGRWGPEAVNVVEVDAPLTEDVGARAPAWPALFSVGAEVEERMVSA